MNEIPGASCFLPAQAWHPAAPFPRPSAGTKLDSLPEPRTEPCPQWTGRREPWNGGGQVRCRIGQKTAWPGRRSSPGSGHSDPSQKLPLGFFGCLDVLCSGCPCRQLGYGCAGNDAPSFFFLIFSFYLFIYLFGCVGSLLLHVGFL